VTICIDHLKVISRHTGVCILDIPHLAIDTKDKIGIWGPSGSGKSTLLNTLNGLNFSDKNLIVEGTVQIGEKTFSSQFKSKTHKKYSSGGPTLFTIQQHLYSGLSPVHTMGSILFDMAGFTGSQRQQDIQREAKPVIELLRLPEDILARYPHQLSGGEIQRFHLMSAVLQQPDYILLDEATASLDHENALHFFNVLLELKSSLDFGLLVVSHDKELLSTYSQQMLFLENGRMQTERAMTPNQTGIQVTFSDSKNYEKETLIWAENLTKKYPTTQNKTVEVLCNVSFTIEKGTFYGLCGNSGAGKSSFGKIVAGILPADAGRIMYQNASSEDFSQKKQHIQRLKHPYIFQDALESLNPAYRLRVIVKRYSLEAETLGIYQPFDSFKENMLAFGLENRILDQFPHQLSGGQAQRVQLALALMFEPGVLILDEPFAFIDEKSTASILNTLNGYKQSRGLSIFCISHQEIILKLFCDEVFRLVDGSFLKIK
jgi:ABC-type dipeptide/oligopeptide/nickel transport system ATPase subunit